MGNPASKSVPNRDLSDLDLFIPNTSHQGIYNFWINTYANIRNVNVLLNSLNVNYSKSSGSVTSDTSDVLISSKDKKMVEIRHLSADDIVFHRGGLCAVPLIEKINLYHLVDGSLLIQASRTPIDSKINEYSFNANGHVPSYDTYFQQLEYFLPQKK
jgi:hypothetical protein